MLPTFETPLWVAQTLTFLLILGFPIALLVGWAYEKLPARATDTDGVEAVRQPAHSTPKKTLVFVGIGSCAVIGLFGFYMMPFIFDQNSFDRNSSNNMSAPVASVPSVLAKGIRSNLMLGETGIITTDGTRTDVSISPDGNLVAYLDNTMPGTSRLMLRDLRFLESDTQITSLSLNGGGGVLKFSPDGEWIIFQDGGVLRRIRIEGGASQEITSQGQANPRIQASHALIGSDLYYVSTADLQVHKTVFSGESNESVMITDGSLIYSAPSAINDEKDQLLITICNTGNFTSWGDCDVGLLNVDTGESTVLIQTAHDATYSSSGHIVFVRDASLWAASYDTEKRQITGSQVPVIQGVEGNSRRGNAAYSLSETGRLIYSPGADIYQGTERMDITWVEKDGERTALPLPEGIYGNISLAPEEDRLAFTAWNGEANDVWIWNIEQEILSRLTFDGDASTPIWTTDGRNIIFTKTRSPFGLWAVSSNGTGQPQQLLESQTQVFPETITEQGEILFSVGNQRKLYSSSDIDDRIQNLIDIGPSQIRSSRISADGKWLLYTSNESGDFETFIRPWPNVNDGKWQASRQGGGQPLWDQDDQTIYFWSSAGQQFSVEYQILSDAESGQQSFRFQQPIEMFAYNEPRQNKTLPGWAYSQKKDKFLMVAQGGLSTAEPIDIQILDQQTNLIIVENWFEELSSLAPSNSN